MKRWTHTTILVILMVSLGVPSVLGAKGDKKTARIILQAEGPTDALVAHIRSLGGTVKFQYRNVPAVAATIPTELMDAVAGFPGVTKVEKDHMMSLHDRPGNGQDAGRSSSFVVENMEEIEVRTVDPTTFDLDALPEGYANFLHTGAIDVWNETDAGTGTIVAVVDTGVVPNVCIGQAVIGAPGFPDGYNATGDGVPATDPANHYHGTHMGSVIASSCAFDFSANPSDPLYQAISAYLPWLPNFVPIFGQAPLAKLYPVKVFDITGAGSPTSVILDGLDHILTLKKSGALDIDIVNMSLGGPTVYDGRDTFDKFVSELWDSNILVVTSAGNSGPTPNSVGSPATAFNSIAVGALDYAISSRVFYEFLGLVFFPGSPGQGLVMRPSDETRVANFSSRGPLSDGRAGPDISALGTWSFHLVSGNLLSWVIGTSPASATVAGSAALLNAYLENVVGEETNPIKLRRVLMGGADKNEVGAAWQGINDQGQGALDVAASLELLKEGKRNASPIRHTGRLRPDILPRPSKNRVHALESDTLMLGPSETADFVFHIDRYTSRVTVEVFDIDAPDNAAYAFQPNRLEINIQSAKRADNPHPIQEFWYPSDPGIPDSFFGDAFTIKIEDGPWTLTDGIPATLLLADQPMEPGLMKVSLAGDISNESAISFKIRITREGYREPPKNPIAMEKILMGDAFLVPVDIPEGVATATFDLTWIRQWNRFPTTDIDMLIFNPDFIPASVDGATLNAPERAVIDFPMPGIWFVVVYGSEMFRPDVYKLYLTTE